MQRAGHPNGERALDRALIAASGRWIGQSTTVGRDFQRCDAPLRAAAFDDDCLGGSGFCANVVLSKEAVNAVVSTVPRFSFAPQLHIDAPRRLVTNIMVA